MDQGLLSKTTVGSISQRSSDRNDISQSWMIFQRIRHHSTSGLKIPEKINSVMFNKPTTTGNLQVIRSCKSSDFSNPHCSHPMKNQQNWARKWANHRAQQAILMKDVHSTKEDSNKLHNCKIARQYEKVLTTKRSPLSLNFRLSNAQFNEKSADVFSRLRSIYSNENERNRRLQNIHERMNELQKKSIKKQVDRSIREFRRRSEEDKSNRKELKRVREKFLETKKNRQSQMHVSQSALDAPAVSRLAYGLPLEGKDFTVSLSSKKTTAEMKNLWRMALLRKQCIDSFMSNISLMHQPLDALTFPQLESSLKRNDRLRSDSEDCTIHRLTKYNSLEKDNFNNNKVTRGLEFTLQSEIIDTFESLSSEDDE